MKITKLGHCCLVLEINGINILTDPGNFTTAQNNLVGLDVVLITHEHQDHYHVESVKALVKHNPQATFIANGAVAKLLEKEGIACTVVGDGQSTEVKGIKIEGFGKDHAQIYKDYGKVENTGYFVADTPASTREGEPTRGGFYFPGDAFYNPGKKVDVLALPVAGPWMKMSMAIDFAKEIKARTAFGVHDGMIVQSFRGFVHAALKMFVTSTEFVELKDGETKKF